MIFQIIVLSFTSFTTENYEDFVYVYDGNNTSAPLLATLSGTPWLLTWRSTQGSMFIRFTSNAYTVYNGFSATYSVISVPGDRERFFDNTV
jgi:hypothetical protein